MSNPPPPDALKPAAPFGLDRRREHRRIERIKAVLTVLDGPAADSTHAITTRDLSLSGISFLLKIELRVGQSCRIEMRPDNAPITLRECEIVRSRSLSNGKYEMGAQFLKKATSSPPA